VLLLLSVAAEPPTLALRCWAREGGVVAVNEGDLFNVRAAPEGLKRLPSGGMAALSLRGMKALGGGVVAEGAAGAPFFSDVAAVLVAGAAGAAFLSGVAAVFVAGGGAAAALFSGVTAV